MFDWNRVSLRIQRSKPVVAAVVFIWLLQIAVKLCVPERFGNDQAIPQEANDGAAEQEAGHHQGRGHHGKDTSFIYLYHSALQLETNIVSPVWVFFSFSFATVCFGSVSAEQTECVISARSKKPHTKHDSGEARNGSTSSRVACLAVGR